MMRAKRCPSSSYKNPYHADERDEAKTRRKHLPRLQGPPDTPGATRKASAGFPCLEKCGNVLPEGGGQGARIVQMALMHPSVEELGHGPGFHWFVSSSW